MTPKSLDKLALSRFCDVLNLDQSGYTVTGDHRARRESQAERLLRVLLLRLRTLTELNAQRDASAKNSKTWTSTRILLDAEFFGIPIKYKPLTRD